MSISERPTANGQEFLIFLQRSIVLAAFVVVLALLGEGVLVWALSLVGGKNVPFTTLWAFAFSSTTLGLLPFNYTGVPLGYGLSRFSRSKKAVAVTRSMRLTTFLIFLGLVLGMSAAHKWLLNFRSIHIAVDAMFFPAAFVGTSAISVIANWRRL